jgi:hypothetical protein
MLRALGLTGFIVVFLVVGGAEAKCRKSCQRQFTATSKSCRAACPRKAAGRDCRTACKQTKQSSLATCRSAASPAPPLCGATTTTTTNTTTTTTTTTVTTLVSTTTAAASTSTTTSSTTSTTLAGASTEGSVSVADVTVVDPAAAAVGGVNGGLIGIAFRDLTTDGGTVVSGTSPIGGCVVTKYDPSHLPHPSHDAGTVTIANAPPAENPATGLLKTVGPCTFLGGAAYFCISNSDSGQSVSATGTDGTAPGTVTFQFAGAPFAGEHLVGSSVVINGFTNPHYDSGPGAFPIVGQPSDSLLVVVDPAGGTDPLEAAPAVQDTIVNAFAPVFGVGAAADFLGAGGVSIAKPASSVFAAIDTTITAVPGDGWSLSDPGDPTSLPLAGPATDLVFGCGNGTPGDANDDTCGAAGVSAVPEMVVSGRATKQDVSALPAFAMPSETSGTDTWLEFECRYVASHSATLTQAALQAIVDFAPTRVEVRVMNAGGAVVTDGPNQTTLLVGHAFAGHTTAP